jgi:WD40 repeat protein
MHHRTKLTLPVKPLLKMINNPKRFDQFSILLLGISLVVAGYILFAWITCRFTEHVSWVYAVDTDKKGTIVSSSETDLYIWENRKNLGRWFAHTEAVKDVAFSKDGKFIASAGMDRAVRVWSNPEQLLVKTFNNHYEGVDAVRFSADDRYIVSAGYDNRLVITNWQMDSVVQIEPITYPAFDISQNNILAFVDSNSMLTLIGLNNFAQRKMASDSLGVPLFHPSSGIIAVSQINSSLFTFIDIQKMDIISRLDIKTPESDRNVSVFRFSPDGRYIIAGIWGGYIEIWDWRNRKLVRKIDASPINSIEDLAWNSNNQLVIASGDKSVAIWNIMNGELIRKMGDGSYFSTLIRLLISTGLLSLIWSFAVVMIVPGARNSLVVVKSLLSVWSIGFFLILYYFRRKLEKIALPVLWVVSLLTFLFFISVWFIPLVLITIPAALCFGFISILSSGRKTDSFVLVAINLLYCVVFWSLSLL